ncbi:Nn.00g034610.m01.CDS01 [Neocucurbitaria sp. VM-36]
MVLELHVWGPAFGLPSIEAECIATIAYCQRVIPKGQWSLIADYNPSTGVTESLPIIFDDGIATAIGFEDIVAYLRNHPAVTDDLDANLSSRQQTDKTAFTTFLQATATPLLDLSLYVSAENYNTTTSSAYTAILPWYANYTVPPRRRELARTRTAHMGLSSLDVDTTAEEGFAPGRGTASSEYEAAKKAAGIPTDRQPNTLSMGRGKGLGGLLGGPMYAARFRLDTLSNELLEPLSDLLGDYDHLLHGVQPSSLDCLAFGYLALLLYPVMPQAWLRETIQTKYPRIATYIRRQRQHLLGNEHVNPADVWSISTGAISTLESTFLPWQPRSQTFSSKTWASVAEIVGNIPLISSLMQRGSDIPSQSLKVSRRAKSDLPSPLFVNTVLGITTAFALGLTSFAIYHRRTPREGELIFWALRPTSSSLGEAGNILSVLAGQIPSASYSQF